MREHKTSYLLAAAGAMNLLIYQLFYTTIFCPSLSVCGSLTLHFPPKGE